PRGTTPAPKAKRPRTNRPASAVLSFVRNIGFTISSVRAAALAETTSLTFRPEMTRAAAWTVEATTPGGGPAGATQSESAAARGRPGAAAPAQAPAPRPPRLAERGRERVLAPAQQPGGLVLRPALQVAEDQGQPPLLGELP